MNAKKVNLELYQCGTCGGYFRTEESANLCCPVCECGNPRKKGYTICDECYARNQLADSNKRWRDAETVEERDLESPYMLHDGSDYYESVEEYLDHGAANGDEPEDMEGWLYVCREVIPFLCAENIACNITESMYEDAELPTDAETILEDACDKINEIFKNKNFGSFEFSWKQKVEVKS